MDVCFNFFEIIKFEIQEIFVCIALVCFEKNMQQILLRNKKLELNPLENNNNNENKYIIYYITISYFIFSKVFLILMVNEQKNFLKMNGLILLIYFLLL